MLGRIKQLSIILMFIGIIGVCFNIIFGEGTVSYIKPYTNSWGDMFYKYDFQAYVKNLATTLQNTTRLELSLPTRTWQTGEWGAVTNDLALIVDYIILTTNILIYPMRIGGYLLQNIWAFIGISYNISTSSEIYWLYQLTNFMQSLQIPYV